MNQQFFSAVGTHQECLRELGMVLLDHEIALVANLEVNHQFLVRASQRRASGFVSGITAQW